ncbi:MAG: hypothetical protein LBG06_11925, partial [Deltaproteobacteria bacterium]|nr:hypothetical protein [Deltaproteobacteria bacterium]
RIHWEPTDITVPDGWYLYIDERGRYRVMKEDDFDNIFEETAGPGHGPREGLMADGREDADVREGAGKSPPALKPYRRRRHDFLAARFTGGNAADIMCIFGKDMVTPCGEDLIVSTPGGEALAEPGDYVALDADGSHHVYAAAFFEAAYRETEG